MTHLALEAAGFVAGAVATAVVTVPTSPLQARYLRWYGSRKDELDLTGTWYQELPAVEGVPGKSYRRKDIVQVRHRVRSGHITANVRRFIADNHEEETYNRRWTMDGVVKGGNLVVVFSPREDNPDKTSYGVVVLKCTDDTHWDGVYARPGAEKDGPNRDWLDIHWTKASS